MLIEQQQKIKALNICKRGPATSLDCGQVVHGACEVNLWVRTKSEAVHDGPVTGMRTSRASSVSRQDVPRWQGGGWVGEEDETTDNEDEHDWPVTGERTTRAQVEMTRGTTHGGNR